MTDPLSVLGAGVGVTSLIMQITDDCIKGFKLFQEAANLPETYRYLHVRIQIEQQRFLNFSLEAGILYADRNICGTLQIHHPLLMAVLAEIKALLENFAEVNGKYKKIMTQEDADRNDNMELRTDLMSLLFQSPEGPMQKGGECLSSKKVESLKRVRELHSTFAQTGRKLRTIIAEPKRLVWAVVDKNSFERLIAKLENLVSSLVALLDRSQPRRLQDTTNTTYLEILQLRNDLSSLATLVKALTPSEENSRQCSESTRVRLRGYDVSIVLRMARI